MLRTFFVLIGAALLLGGCARTVTVSWGDCIVGDPPDTGVWIWVNGAEAAANDIDLAGSYPERALRQALQGEATLHCVDGACVITDQALAPRDCNGPDCWTREAYTADYGFGAVAEKSARARGLIPAAGSVDVRVAFRITGPGRGREWQCGQTPPP